MDGGLKVDAVSSRTPPSARLGVLEKTAARGMHAHDREAARLDRRRGREDRRRSRGSKPGVVFAVGFCHRFAPAIQRMRELAAGGKVGHLIRFENTFAFHHPPMAEKWFSDPDVSGGGALIDAGCHSIDLFHFVVGPAEAGRRGASIRPWPGRGESGATALFRCTGGATCGGRRRDRRGLDGGRAVRGPPRRRHRHALVRLHEARGSRLPPVSGRTRDHRRPSPTISGSRVNSRTSRSLRKPTPGSRRPMAGVDDGVAAARSIAGAIALAGG
jgi:predicted dehydrogenase